MRSDLDKPYYTAYNKRYKSVYAEGVRYWTACPEELSAIESEIHSFLEKFHLQADETLHIVEFGCGEGYVGELLAQCDYRYTGIDIAESAAQKATERLARFGDRARVLVADVLDLSIIPDAAFDAGIDIGCLHLLVVDADRRTYLQNAYRVLKTGAPVMFKEAFRPNATSATVDSYEAWLQINGIDVDTHQERDAWQDGKLVKIQLPCIVARPRTVEQYRSEIEAGGFEFLNWLVSADGLSISFHVRKSDESRRSS
jgi:cyclopropane fatty-acyl-phospholipid synthase-like methyltransferase